MPCPAGSSAPGPVPDAERIQRNICWVKKKVITFTDRRGNFFECYPKRFTYWLIMLTTSLQTEQLPAHPHFTDEETEAPRDEITRREAPELGVPSS